MALVLKYKKLLCLIPAILLFFVVNVKAYDGNVGPRGDLGPILLVGHEEKNPSTLYEPEPAGSEVTFEYFTQVRGDQEDLDVSPSKHRPRNNKYSYNRQSKPKNRQYATSSGSSTGGKLGKGGYHGSDSYKGSTGYSSDSSYEKARKDDYGDSNHKEFKHKDGDKYGVTDYGSTNKSAGKYGRAYGDNGASYYRGNAKDFY